MTCTHHVPVLAFVHNCHGFKSKINITSQKQVGGLWASYDSRAVKSFLGAANLTFFLPSTSSILHLSTSTKSTAEASDGKPLFSVCSSSTEPLTSAESFAGELRYFVGDQDFSKYIVRSYPDDTEVFDLRRISSQSSSNKCNWTEISY